MPLFVIILIHINQGEAGDDNNTKEEAVIRFWSGFAWLIGMTLVIALLSEYVVQTIEEINCVHFSKWLSRFLLL